MEYVASARWNFSALAQAAARGDKGEVAGLLASGAMVNDIDDAPYIDPFGGRQPPSTLSALYLAAAKGHAEIVRTLLAHGADPRVGASALAAASRRTKFNAKRRIL